MEKFTKGDRLRLLIIAGAILIIIVAVGGRSDKPTTPASNSAAPKIESQARQNEKAAAEENNAVAGEKEVVGDLVKVTRVIDGDTIEIEDGEHIRYIGIDTPETVDPRKPVQCFGVEASAKNKELVEGKMVRLEKDITDKDKYDRLLRYIWVGDSLINLELVKRGFAYSYSYPPDIKYQDQFVKAQQEAREAKRGLWNSCQSDSRVSGDISLPISEEGLAGNCLIKGNISSSNEKIYHLPGCGSYSKTQIDESRGEKWFCTEAEAQAAGWRKALNCP